MPRKAFIDTLPREVRKKIRSDSYTAHAKAQESLAESARIRYEKNLAEGPGDGMYWPFFPRLIELPIKHKEIVKWIAQNPGKRLIDRPSQRPQNKCLHHRPHRCFHPTDTTIWVFVRWLWELNPHYLPMREFQPSHIRQPAQARFCCPEAGYLFGEELEREGACNIVLVRKDTERTETISEYSDRFYGLKPCWTS